MNQVQLTGEIADTPEPRTTQTGKTVLNLRIKNTERWATGESTSYWTVVLWEDDAKRVVAAGATVGSFVFVAGRLASRSYEAKDGSQKWVTEIRAKECEVIGHPAPAPLVAAATVSAPQGSTYDSGDELPW